MHLRCVVSQVEAEQPQEDPEATPKRPGRRGRPSKAAATEDPGEEIWNLNPETARVFVSKKWASSLSKVNWKIGENSC